MVFEIKKTLSISRGLWNFFRYSLYDRCLCLLYFIAITNYEKKTQRPKSRPSSTWQYWSKYQFFVKEISWAHKLKIRVSHPIFGQWASKDQARTNHSKVHARAEKFSTYYIMYVLRKNYWTFMHFVDFLSFHLISLIRWKVLSPFRQPRHLKYKDINEKWSPYKMILYKNV